MSKRDSDEPFKWKKKLKKEKQLGITHTDNEERRRENEHELVKLQAAKLQRESEKAEQNRLAEERSIIQG